MKVVQGQAWDEQEGREKNGHGGKGKVTGKDDDGAGLWAPDFVHERGDVEVLEGQGDVAVFAGEEGRVGVQRWLLVGGVPRWGFLLGHGGVIDLFGFEESL